MTLQEILAKIDELKPNDYSQQQKIKWIDKVNRIAHERLMIKEDYVSLSESDQSIELLIPEMYEDCYTSYVFSMIDFHNNEMPEYNNSAMNYNNEMGEFKKYCIREGHVGKQPEYKNIEP